MGWKNLAGFGLGYWFAVSRGASFWEGVICGGTAAFMMEFLPWMAPWTKRIAKTIYAVAVFVAWIAWSNARRLWSRFQALAGWRGGAA